MDLQGRLCLVEILQFSHLLLMLVPHCPPPLPRGKKSFCTSASSCFHPGWKALPYREQETASLSHPSKSHGKQISLCSDTLVHPLVPEITLTGCLGSSAVEHLPLVQGVIPGVSRSSPTSDFLHGAYFSLCLCLCLSLSLSLSLINK